MIEIGSVLVGNSLLERFLTVYETNKVQVSFKDFLFKCWELRFCLVFIFVVFLFLSHRKKSIEGDMYIEFYLQGCIRSS